MTTAYFDCRFGISGDMCLAACAQLGVDLAPLQNLFVAAGVPCVLRHWQEYRAAGAGGRVEVAWQADEQPLRHPADLRALFEAIPCAPRVREQALRVLAALTKAEAHAHGIAEEAVYFHEVGAIDTLVDIFGLCWALDSLGVQRVLASPLPLFSGTVQCAHGILPLPAPATAYLLHGKPVFATDEHSELITPTGAALVHALVEGFEPAPTGRVRAMATGYGARPQPCGLRLWLMESDALCCATRQAQPEQDGTFWETVMQLETNLDHLTGEELGEAISQLSASDAVLDVLWLAGITKKNRQGGVLRVLCHLQQCEAAEAAVFRLTHTLGIRRQTLTRHCLPRHAGQREGLPAKCYSLEGQDYARVEAEALRALPCSFPAWRFKHS
ncbi:MAG: LarC family nickel insertion protein [Desulfovibrionaceae bacterium]|nr:LarC family nickel insertion protein [Desulfovibrionaceae bacterium]